MGINNPNGMNPLGNNDPNMSPQMMAYQQALMPSKIGQSIQAAPGSNASAGNNAALAKIASALLGMKAMDAYKKQYLPQPGQQPVPNTPQNINPVNPNATNPALRNPFAQAGPQARPLDNNLPMVQN